MLVINNLSAFYGNIEALRAVDLWVRTGTITTIIGANGAGKTTLLRAISGLIPTRYGEILYFGKDIANLEPHKIVKLGISHVPEGRQVFASLSVEENLQLGAYLRSGRRQSRQVKEDIAFVCDVFPVLGERMGQSAGTLSGGEQQMLAIARALMSRPKLLLLDEPSMGLAPLVIRDIFSCLKRLHEEGLTILLVEQDAQIALSVSDYGYVMRAGKIRLEGETSELLKSEEIRHIYLGEEGLRKGEMMELKFDDKGLIPAIIQDAESGEVLMLGYMNEESLRMTLESGRTWFWSRSRQELWCKGETSGNRQYVREVRYDCDGDALLVRVEQVGPACHTGERTCFYRSIADARTDLEPGG